MAFHARFVYEGFFQLRYVQLPVVCAVHGKLIGGGIATMMSADYVVADVESTFCHGNLVRGVCPIGMFSRTLTTVAGLSRSLRIYLSNDTHDAATAKRFRLVDETAAGVKVTQNRACEVATMLAAQEEQAHILLAARLPYDAGLVATEAVGIARCLLSHGGYTPAALPDSHSAQAMQLYSTVLELAPQLIVSAPIVHVVEVPTTLTSNGMSDTWLQWPSNALLIFRGSSPDSFCLGEDPSAAHISDGSFLDGVELFTQLLERIEQVGMPTIVVCPGATRGGGMLFPCLGSIVLAHTDATFGFPEVLCSALPGVVSIAAKRRLGEAACERLFCTGDTVDAATACQLGLVDFVGSGAQVEAYVTRLAERFMALGPVWVSAIEQVPHVHQPLHNASIPVEVDGKYQVLTPKFPTLPCANLPGCMPTSRRCSNYPLIVPTRHRCRRWCASLLAARVV
jgi:enoyl-CoA hydratase/carnithine racemase